MTLGGKITALFPACHLGLIIGTFYIFVREPSPSHFILFLAMIYLLPVAVFRLHDEFFPVKEGVTDLSAPTYSPWWGGHQFQMLFIAVPALEGPIHMVPGLFSFWLRLWGSKVGKRVYWTPKVEIVDRSLVEIGDYATIGHLSVMCSHLVTPINGRASLIVQKVRIGRGAMIAGKVGLGPGSTVKDGDLVKFGTTLYWKGTKEI